MFKYKTMIIAVILSLTGTSAFGVTLFSDLDTDGNGNISKDEYDNFTGNNRVYASWDLNSDGQIDRNEYATFDIDDDGYYDHWNLDEDTGLTSNEVNNGIFSYYDRDANGRWNGNEWHDAGKTGLFDL